MNRAPEMKASTGTPGTVLTQTRSPCQLNMRKASSWLARKMEIGEPTMGFSASLRRETGRYQNMDGSSLAYRTRGGKTEKAVTHNNRGYASRVRGAPPARRRRG